MKNNIQNKNFISGFTLIELMVAISIFMIIMTIALGSLLSASDVSNKARELGMAMDNVNFAMESMTRSIRMGTEYSCQDGLVTTTANLNPCSADDSGNALKFKSSASDNQPGEIIYALYSRNDESHGLKKCVDSICLADLVSDEVSVTDLKFFVKGSSTSDDTQPSVYILMKGEVDVKGEKSPFALQTMTSQRNLEQQ